MTPQARRRNSLIATLALLSALPAAAQPACLETQALDPWPGQGLLYKVRYFDPANVLVIGNEDVLASSDSGRTWRLLPVTPIPKAAQRVLNFIHNDNRTGRYHSSLVRDDSTAYIAGPGGILQITRDKGATWKRAATGLDEIVSVHAAPGGGLYLEAGNRDLYRADADGGGARKLHAGIEGTNFFFDDSTTVNLQHGSIFHGEILGGSLRRSQDAGKTWEEIPTPYLKAFWLDRSDDTTAYLLAYERSYVSRDKGLTWREVTGSFTVTPWQGTFSSWQYAQSYQDYLGTAWLDSTRALKTAADGGTLFRRVSGSQGWAPILPINLVMAGGITSVVDAGEGTGFALAYDRKTGARTAYRLSVGGKAWAPLPRPGEALLPDFNKLEWMAVRADGALLAVGMGGLFLREDSVSGWEKVPLPVHADYRQILMAGDSVGYLLGLPEIGTLNMPWTFLKTRDGGRSWSRLPAAFKGEVGGLRFRSPDTGYILHARRVLKTTDGGQTWSALHPDRFSAVRYFELLDDGTLFLMQGENDLFTSRDAGATWDRDFRVVEPLDNQLGYPRALPGGRIILFGGSDQRKMVVSGDAGRTWKGPFVSDPARRQTNYLGGAILTSEMGGLHRIGFDACFASALEVAAPARKPRTARPVPAPAHLFRSPRGWLADLLGRFRPAP